VLARAALLVVFALVAACSAAPAAAPSCTNRDVQRELYAQQICIGSHVAKLVTSGEFADVTRARLPSPQVLPAGTKSLTYPATGGIDVGGQHAIAVGPDAVWLASNGLWKLGAGDEVVNADPASNQLQEVSYAYGTLWIDGQDTENVPRLDVSGRQVGAVEFQGDTYPFGEFPAFGSMWIALHHEGLVARVDPAFNRVVTSVQVGFPGSDGPWAVEASQGSLWVAVPNINSVLRIDPGRGEIVASIPFPGGPDGDSNPCGLAVTRSAIWVTMCGSHRLAEIDPRRNRVSAVYDLGASPTNIWIEGDNMWTAVGGDPQATPDAPGYLLKMRPDGTVTQSYALGTGVFPGYVAMGLGFIWIAEANRAVVLRIPVGNL
jgi:hypothetical protein